MAGYPIILADTAGLRPTSDEIEAEGVRRAIARAKSADLNLVLFDGTRWPALDPQSEALVNEGSMALLSKADLAPDLPSEPRVAGRPALAISIRTGVGIERRAQKIAVGRIGENGADYICAPTLSAI